MYPLWYAAVQVPHLLKPTAVMKHLYTRLLPVTAGPPGASQNWYSDSVPALPTGSSTGQPVLPASEVAADTQPMTGAAAASAVRLATIGTPGKSISELPVHVGGFLAQAAAVMPCGLGNAAGTALSQYETLAGCKEAWKYLAGGSQTDRAGVKAGQKYHTTLVDAQTLTVLTARVHPNFTSTDVACLLG